MSVKKNKEIERERRRGRERGGRVKGRMGYQDGGVCAALVRLKVGKEDRGEIEL